MHNGERDDNHNEHGCTSQLQLILNNHPPSLKSKMQPEVGKLNLMISQNIANRQI